MKLSVSNIAWEPDELDDHLQLIKRCGCHGVEIAPGLIWEEPVTSTAKERKQFKKRIESFGLKVVGLHALLFTRPDLELFGPPESRGKLGEYLNELFALCHDLGGKTLIFGSPKNRNRHGKDIKECMRIAKDFFAGLAPAAKKSEVILCLEPLSVQESDFLTTSEQGAALIEAIGHPHIGLHLDAKAMFESGEDFKQVFSELGPLVRHFHVGDSGLTPPGSKGFDHRIPGRVLRDTGYKNYVSIEMRRGFGPSRDVIEKSIDYIKDCYDIS